MSEKFLYFIATQDFALVKAGISTDPAERFLAISKWSPVKLKFMGQLPGTHHDEKAVHACYLNNHSHFEWFVSTPEMLVDIRIAIQNQTLPQEWRGTINQKNPLLSIASRNAMARRKAAKVEVSAANPSETAQ